MSSKNESAKNIFFVNGNAHENNNEYNVYNITQHILIL